MNAPPMYLSGVTNGPLEAAVNDGLSVGLLIQPGNGYATRIDRFSAWAADNGCFAAGAAFSLDAFLEYLRDPRLLERRERCLFATAPDVVGDAAATLERALPAIDRIRELGYPVAFVGQDGSEDDVDSLIPWSSVDVLFLGGSTEWKVDPDRAGVVAAAARSRGIPVHMGRVNSLRRLRIAQSFGCATADGTFLAFGPDTNLPRLRRWIETLENEREEVAA